MKDHHTCPRVVLGFSDIASLVLRSPCDVKILDFCGDDCYSCYLADPDTAIPVHYSLVYECDGWLKIYDDFMLCAEFCGEKIQVYRAGGFGCIVRVYPQTSAGRYSWLPEGDCRCVEYDHELPMDPPIGEGRIRFTRREIA